MDTIVIGLGNPVLADDRVGLEIAHCLEERLRGRSDVGVTQIFCGGMNLMEAMAGHERAIIVDAMTGGGGSPGTVYALGPGALLHSRNTCSSHDASLSVALELGALAGLRLPRDVRIWAVEADDVSTFSENLTPHVRHAVPLVVEDVVRHLESTE
ncbi:MAG: hydrogenase maturation protease [Acidobacteriia bacterium]|nr:hydrogenase maturation protease [Terriglobia bacterium]